MPNILIAIFLLFTVFISCKSKIKNKIKAPIDSTYTLKSNYPASLSPDSTSSDYLIYLLKNENPLNNYWEQKLNMLDVFALPMDSLSHLSLVRDWVINDSVSAIIISHSTGTDYEEFLLTIKNKGDFISKVRISDQADSDLSLEHPYYYTEYKFISDLKLKLFNHKVTGVEGGEEKDKIESVENWIIQSNGKILKK